jgi:hypothetical protein
VTTPPTGADLDVQLTEAHAASRAVIGRCGDCETSFWHPRAHCPRCGSRDVALVDPSGPARVYTATTNRRPRGGEDAPPVQVGYVEFPEGVRMLVTFRFPGGTPPIGAEVVPDYEVAGDSGRLVFRPAPRD